MEIWRINGGQPLQGDHCNLNIIILGKIMIFSYIVMLVLSVFQGPYLLGEMPHLRKPTIDFGNNDLKIVFSY